MRQHASPMSSCLADEHGCPVGQERSVDDVGQASFEGTQGFGSGVADGDPLTPRSTRHSVTRYG
jgi:hypothetical protein